MVPETTENYALLQCQKQETQYGCCVASHSWQSECFHALLISPGVFISQKVAATVSLVTKWEAGLAFQGPSSQTQLGWGAGTAAVLLAQPQEQYKPDTGQEFCLMHCQAKNLLWEAKFFMGGKSTAVI